jgi:hypothetical protein
MVNRLPTLADVCSAIAEGHIPAAIEGSVYKVNAFELRRYLNRSRSLPSISSAIQDSSSCSEVSEYPASTHTSVA